MWEVRGCGPGVEAAAPKGVSLLAEVVSEVHEVGADAAPVVSAERPLPHRLSSVSREHPMVVEARYEVIPLRAGVPPGGPNVGVMSVEMGHNGVSLASIGVIAVEEG